MLCGGTWPQTPGTTLDVFQNEQDPPVTWRQDEPPEGLFKRAPEALPSGNVLPAVILGGLGGAGATSPGNKGLLIYVSYAAHLTQTQQGFLPPSVKSGCNLG